jgi:hypothetical protein
MERMNFADKSQWPSLMANSSGKHREWRECQRRFFMRINPGTKIGENLPQWFSVRLARLARIVLEWMSVIRHYLGCHERNRRRIAINSLSFECTIVLVRLAGSPTHFRKAPSRSTVILMAFSGMTTERSRACRPLIRCSIWCDPCVWRSLKCTPRDQEPNEHIPE